MKKSSDEEYLEKISIHRWIQKYGIKNETGIPIDFYNHMYLFDIYRDFSKKLAIAKGAQVGATLMEILKSLWGIRNMGLDSIYVLPTYEDVNSMVGSKVNRIIAQNPILQQWTADKDTIDQKQIGDHYIHYRGSWTSKAAIMVSSDWNCYDEVDACKMDVVEQYATRLQHSKHKMEHYFSHPSAQGAGIDRFWQVSNQRHWFVTCQKCKKEQYLDWPESIDIVRKIYQCKYCKHEISDDDRRRGRWVAKYKLSDERPFSGYWIPLLICPLVSAKEILEYHRDKSEEYFYNKVLGKPFVGSGNKLTRQHFFQNLTSENLYPQSHENVVMGLDTGTQLYYVLGTERGIFHYGIAKDYDEIDELMARWLRMTVICDQMGDLIGSRSLRERHPGRVYLCLFGEDRKTKELIRWGKNDEHGSVIADRNRMFRLLVGEFIDKRIPVMGTEEDWDEFMIHWGNLTQITVMDDTTGTVKGKKWVKNGQSDFPFCFAGETLVTTDKGDVPIKDIKIGDRVLTRSGYHTVLNSGRTKKNSPVYRFSTDDGYVFATREHRFFTEERGFDIVSVGDTIKVCKRNQHESMEYCLQDTLNRPEGIIGSTSLGHINKRKSLSTDIFMQSTLERYQKVLSCITRTIIHWITQSKTLLLSREANINHTMLKKHGKEQMTKKEKECLQKKLSQNIFGIGQNMAEVSCQIGQRISIGGSLYVKFVKRKQKSGVDKQSSALKNAVQFMVQDVGEPSIQNTRVNTISFEKNADVYDIEVEDAHEFFANGFLVHNCALYWRIGMERMGSNGSILIPDQKIKYPTAPVILPGNKMHNTKVPMYEDKKINDWRV